MARLAEKAFRATGRRSCQIALPARIGEIGFSQARYVREARLVRPQHPGQRVLRRRHIAGLDGRDRRITLPNGTDGIAIDHAGENLLLRLIGLQGPGLVAQRHQQIADAFVADPEVILPAEVGGVGLGAVFSNGAAFTVGGERVVEMAAFPLDIPLAKMRPKHPFAVAGLDRHDHLAIGRLRQVELSGLLLEPAIPEQGHNVRRVQPGGLRIILPRPPRIGNGGDRCQGPIGSRRGFGRLSDLHPDLLGGSHRLVVRRRLQ
jgi:hypothetical protein